ncbi:MAG: hypothetical protein ACXABY_33835 [Candidatus Thorarchaeota archaeon]|jgi:hypothetical protein
MATKKVVDYVTLPNGGKLYLLPISQADIQGITLNVEKKWKEDGEPIDIPTYSTSIGEVIEWDKESIEKDGSPEEKEAWSLHELSIKRMHIERNQKIAYFVLTESPKKYETAKGSTFPLVIDDLEPEWEPPQTWLKRQQKIASYELPDDPYDRKYDFVSSLLGEASLVFGIISKATALAMRGAVTDEGVAKIEATFQGAMETEQRKAEPRVLAAIGAISGVSGEEA